MERREDAAAPKRPVRLLIIDDDADIVEILCLRFKRDAAFEVESARDAALGLEKARTFQPHVVLLDVVMPRTDGWELCRRLRSDPSTAKIAVVAMTAQDGAADRARAQSAQVHAVLTKPLDLAGLVQTVLSAAGAAA